MDLRLSLNEDFKIIHICFRGNKSWYNGCQLGESSRLAITKGNYKLLIIQEPDKSASRYAL